ncbi:hypothetical protein MMG00_08265 [Ignatzschineria rhizosphaerae]|uniref:Uncharacterized protein n=1 Tax=Ignatzschineria rhizosphaerae TaxID=2923279 RepID=A0ABY3X5E3_9GAMM|nr:hypothetical protein [Ignatzschineria rhizosphaerae]UNM95223.1 hypothetical protein MMG00_08265 [Ignatzschineria rhizosphaerae]
MKLRASSFKPFSVRIGILWVIAISSQQTDLNAGTSIKRSTKDVLSGTMQAGLIHTLHYFTFKIMSLKQNQIAGASIKRSTKDVLSGTMQAWFDSHVALFYI